MPGSPCRSRTSHTRPNTAAVQQAHADDIAAGFEQLAQILESVNLGELWEDATEQQRRTILDELLDDVTAHRDRLSVTIHGAPPLDVAFSEVGLKDSELSRVGGASPTVSTRDPWDGWLDVA